MRGDWRSQRDYLLCAGDRGARTGYCEQNLDLLLDSGSVPSLNPWLPECKAKGRSCAHSAPTRPLVDDLVTFANKRRTNSPILDTPRTHCYSPKLRPSFKCLVPSDICASILSPLVIGACAFGSAYYATRPPVAPLYIVPITVAATPWHPSKLTSGVRVVRAILNDLLDSVSFDEQVKTESSIPSVITYTRSSTPRIENTHDSSSANTRCSVATQAHVLQSVCSDSVCSNSSPVRASSNWRGGVRALRDSHVKLVLRQLRHVERLNRALDSTTTQPLRSALYHTRNRR